jgi:Universal stress protein family
MSIYRRILLAVDLNADSIAVGRRARDLAALVGAELTVLHVVEYVPVEPVGENMIPPVPMLEELASSGWSHCAPTSASTPTISASRSAASRAKSSVWRAPCSVI